MTRKSGICSPRWPTEPIRSGKNARQRVTFLPAYIRIGLGSLFLLVAVFFFSLFIIPGIDPDDRKDLPILLAYGAALALLPLVSAVWDLVGGVGLLKRRRWARILVLIGCVPELLAFPVWTATGVYTIWILMQKETKKLLADDPG